MKPFARDNLSVSLNGRRVLLGVTGSIAAYKACELVRGLRTCGAEVRVILTEGGSRFITATTLQALSGQPVLTTLWENPGHGMRHIDTAQWAELVAVAPASANALSKLAQGAADDLLSTELLAFRGPQLVAPAMNPAMFTHPAVQANLATLAARGWRVLGPASGTMACGDEGAGRMLEPADILSACAQAFFAHKNGRRAVITLGPTQSRLDPVRFLTNRSSGKMGAALCWAAARAGYDVIAVTGPIDDAEAPLPPGIERVAVSSAAEMADAALERWEASDLFIGAAAVLDWDVARPASSKLKKETGAPAIELRANTDILAEAARRKRPGQYVLGFAAETASGDALSELGRSKRMAKHCDAIFANDVSGEGGAFDSTANGGFFLGTHEAELSARPKAALASEILKHVEAERGLA